MSTWRETFGRQAVLLMACMALMVRVLVPAGFMLAAPGQAHAGGIPIVLCTSGGMEHALLQPDGTIVAASADDGGTPGDDDAAGVNHCDCVLKSAVVEPDVAVRPVLALVWPPLPQADGPARSLDLAPGRGLAAPPPPATAPPALI